jgi:hypothetical protein
MTRSQRSLAYFASLVLLSASSVSAGVVNGSFQSGFSGWTGAGPNSSVPVNFINVASTSPAPTDSTLMAYLHNGTGAKSVALHNILLNSLGLPASYISTNFPGATQGATLLQTFNLTASENEIEFDWNFLTNEDLPPMVSNRDFGFAHLLNNANAIVGSAFLDTNSVGFTSGLGADYDHELGWQTVSFSGLTPGATYKLVFGLFDVTDNFTNSGLLIDRIVAVPEPSTALLFGIGSCLCLTIRRRR